MGSLRDREVACSASDRQGSNFESCVWRTVSSQSSHHPQEVLLAQFSLYVHKGGLKPDSFHFILSPVKPPTRHKSKTYKVVARSGRVFKVLIKGKVATVTADRVKPAHIERTPENEQTRQSTAMSKTNGKRPTAKIHEPQTAVVGKRSTTTRTPFEAGVCTKQNLNGQSTAMTKATVPEVDRRGEKPEEQSNTKATLYKAQQVRNTTTSRANGRYDGIRTYSRIPLHLRKDVPILTQQNKRIENRNESHTDNSRRVTINPLPTQTLVGRQIHTPARFVKLVQAVIAPNDIYCGPSARIT